VKGMRRERKEETRKIGEEKTKRQLVEEES